MSLKNWFLKEQFSPSAAGIFVNFLYFGRRAIAATVKEFSHGVRGDVLDIGCGCKPYERLFKGVTRYVGVDVKSTGHDHATSKVDVFFDGKKLPFGDGKFDSAVAFEVLEHVFDPDAFLAEAQRVLKPGGTFLLTVPFVWDEHETPYDFARYTSFGLRHLFETRGFTVLKSKKYLADASLFVLLANNAAYKWLADRVGNKAALLMCLPFSSVTNLLGFLLKPFRNPHFYFGNAFLLQKTR